MSSNEAKGPSFDDWVTKMCQMMCDTIVIHYIKISEHICDRVGFLVSGHKLWENFLGANFSNKCVNYGFWIWHVATDSNSWMIWVIQWKDNSRSSNDVTGPLYCSIAQGQLRLRSQTNHKQCHRDHTWKLPFPFLKQLKILWCFFLVFMSRTWFRLRASWWRTRGWAARGGRRAAPPSVARSATADFTSGGAGRATAAGNWWEREELKMLSAAGQ